MSTQPRIYCDKASINVKEIIADLDIALEPRPVRADMIWLRQRKRLWHDFLSKYQLINHIPHEGGMTDKGRLYEHIWRYAQQHPNEATAIAGFIPQTYRLYDEADRAAFFAQLPAQENKHDVWVLKPTSLSKGKGIKLLWQFDALRQHYEPQSTQTCDFIDTNVNYIIQRHVKDPLLIKERKSEIRVYWLLASVEPKAAFLFDTGTTRVCSQPFHYDDYDNKLRHVTNVYQQKMQAGFDPDFELKLSFKDLQQHLLTQKITDNPNYIDDVLMPKIRDILRTVVNATMPELALLPKTGICFGLYGADLILDNKGNPWLTEIQIGPGLSHDDPIKREVIADMIKEAVSIMLEVKQRKIQESSYENIEALQHFQPIF